MESPKDHVEAVLENAQTYGRTTLELTKLKALEHASRAAGSMAVQFVTLLAVSLFILMLSVGCALIIGKALGASWIGFMIMAAFYLLLILLLRSWLAEKIQIWVGDSVVNSALN